jgi:hypothetical protein
MSVWCLAGDREDFSFPEDLSRLYAEKSSPGEKPSRSHRTPLVLAVYRLIVRSAGGVLRSHSAAYSGDLLLLYPVTLVKPGRDHAGNALDGGS